jgi:ADP-L-glycero-D-manno-heptose 6-epimerase
MKYLVTGGAGFIGSNIAFSLIKERKEEAVILDNFSSGHFKNLIGFTGDVIAGDIRDNSWWEKVGRVDAIFHEAAITDTTVMDQKLMMDVNVEGFKNILNFALKYDIRTIIYASSAATYGNGKSPMNEDQTPLCENVYGFSKAIMDNVAKEFWTKNPKFKVVGLKYFNVYGPGEYYKGKFASMIYQLYLQMKQNKQPRVFKYGEQSRDFVYIKDIVKINLNALEAENSCIVNAGSGKAETFNEVISCLNKALKTDLMPEYFDNPYDFFQQKTQADLRKAKYLLNYNPEWKLEEGISDYVKILEKK